MNKKPEIKKIISWILVILWMILIFFMSHNNGEQSSGHSNKVVSYIYISITKEQNVSEEVLNKYTFPVRKLSHITEYLILTLLLINAFNNTFRLSNKRKYIFVFLILVIYAILDEYHQTFIPGRSGQVIDVLIDSIGIIIGIIINLIYVNKIKSKS